MYSVVSTNEKTTNKFAHFPFCFAYNLVNLLLLFTASKKAKISGKNL